MEHLGDTLVSGSVFNDMVSSQRLYMITDDRDENSGYVISGFLGTIKVDMDVEGDVYYSGGIEIVMEDDIFNSLNCSNNPMFVYDVNVPNDSIVAIEDGVIKVSRLCTTKRTEIRELPVWSDEEKCKKLITVYPLLIRFMRDEDVNLEDDYVKAITTDSRAIQFIKNKTPELCRLAVQICGDNLKYVDDQTEELCIIAVTETPHALKYVKNQTEDIAIQAVKRNGLMIDYVKNQTDNVCLAALTEDIYSIQFIKNPSDKICRFAISKKPYIVQYIENPTVEHYIMALMEDPACITYIDTDNKDLLFSCFVANPNIINYITDPTVYRLLAEFERELVAFDRSI